MRNPYAAYKSTSFLLILTFFIGANCPAISKAQIIDRKEFENAETKTAKNRFSSFESSLSKNKVNSSNNVIDSPVDLNAIKKANAGKQQKPGMSKTEKTFLVVFIVGTAVLVFLVAKYGKPIDCLNNPPYCSPDELSCICS